MKKLIVLTAVLFWTVSCQEKNKSFDSKSQTNPDAMGMRYSTDGVVTLKVQVLDKLDSVKKTLTKAVAENIFKFKVLEAINGTYNKTEIRIKILFPLETIESKRLENEKIYTYKLIPGSYINSEQKRVPTDYYEIWEDSPAGSQR